MMKKVIDMIIGGAVASCGVAIICAMLISGSVGQPIGASTLMTLVSVGMIYTEGHMLFTRWGDV